MRQLLIVLLSIVFFTSCSPAVSISVFEPQLREPNQREINVFSNPQAVDFSYKEIGLITIDDQGWGRSEGELLKTAVIKAKQIGADAIIILSQNKNIDGFVPVGNVPVAINSNVIRVSAIVKVSEAKRKQLYINSTSVADEIAKLKKLKDEGVLTEEEFQKQKEQLLNK